MRNNSKRIALCGMLAAVAVVIMCLGGLIPVATYACPMLCCLTQFLVFRFCGRRLAWTWFLVVSILSLLMVPDKEAAMVFFAVGGYPMLKPVFESKQLSVLLKCLYFNFSIFCVYAVMIHVMGMQEVAAENMEFGLIGLTVILLLGNLVFFMLDKLLTILAKRVR